MTACRLFFSLCIFFFTAVLESAEAGGWGIQGELLYFTPSYDETYYVLVGSIDDGAGSPMPKGRRMNNPVGFNLGYRIEGVYDFCPSRADFRLRWTHLFATSLESVSKNEIPPQLWPIEIIPSQPNVSEPFSGEASSHIGIMYQKGECLFDERGWNFGCGCMCFREGIEWSYIRYHEVVNYIEIAGPQEQIRLHAHTKGIGPQLGVIFVFEPALLLHWHPRNLTYRLMTTGTLIAANSKCKVSTTNTLSVEANNTQQSFWRIVPEWVFRFGINHIGCCRRFRTSLEIGYEITTYIRGTSKLIFTDSASPGVSFNQYSDFYVHGLFFALGVYF